MAFSIPVLAMALAVVHAHVPLAIGGVRLARKARFFPSAGATFGPQDGNTAVYAAALRGAMGTWTAPEFLGQHVTRDSYDRTFRASLGIQDPPADSDEPSEPGLQGLLRRRRRRLASSRRPWHFDHTEPATTRWLLRSSASHESQRRDTAPLSAQAVLQPKDLEQEAAAVTKAEEAALQAAEEAAGDGTEAQGPVSDEYSQPEYPHVGYESERQRLKDQLEKAKLLQSMADEDAKIYEQEVAGNAKAAKEAAAEQRKREQDAAAVRRKKEQQRLESLDTANAYYLTARATAGQEAVGLLGDTDGESVSVRGPNLNGLGTGAVVTGFQPQIVGSGGGGGGKKVTLTGGDAAGDAQTDQAVSDPKVMGLSSDQLKGLAISIAGLSLIVGTLQCLFGRGTLWQECKQHGGGAGCVAGCLGVCCGGCSGCNKAVQGPALAAQDGNGNQAPGPQGMADGLQAGAAPAGQTSRLSLWSSCGGRGDGRSMTAWGGGIESEDDEEDLEGGAAPVEDVTREVRELGEAASPTSPASPERARGDRSPARGSGIVARLFGTPRQAAATPRADGWSGIRFGTPGGVFSPTASTSASADSERNYSTPLQSPIPDAGNRTPA